MVNHSKHSTVSLHANKSKGSKIVKKVSVFGEEEFTASVAHELRTPLTALKLMFQHIKKSSTNVDAKTAHEFQIIDRELINLTQLINDFLEVSRIHAGHFSLNKSLIDVRSLLVEAVEECRSLAPEKQIFLEMDDDTKVVADPQRVKQVMTNFLSNAVKYSGTSEINVSICVDDRYVTVIVQNNGPIIEIEEQKKLFTPYYRVNMNSKKGFGLGLFIAKQIILQHEGKIGCLSSDEDGTIFFFSLPKADNLTGSDVLH